MEFLQEFTLALENHYFHQLTRYSKKMNEVTESLFCVHDLDDDIPF